MKNKILGLIALCLLTGPTAANAYAITIDSTVDLFAATISGNTSTGFDGFALHGLYPLEQSVLVSTGDTGDMIIRFLDGQSLTLVTESERNWIFPWLYPDFDLSPPGLSNFSISGISMFLYDAAGAVVGTYSRDNETDGNSHLGPFFYGAVAPGSSITFAAVRTSYTVVALETNQYYYTGPFLQVGARDGGGVRINTSVPEPGTLALLGLGLLGLGFSRRRKLN